MAKVIVSGSGITISVALILVLPALVCVIITSCDKEYGNGRNSLSDDSEPEKGPVEKGPVPDCEVRPNVCANSVLPGSAYVLYCHRASGCSVKPSDKAPGGGTKVCIPKPYLKGIRPASQPD